MGDPTAFLLRVAATAKWLGRESAKEVALPAPFTDALREFYDSMERPVKEATRLSKQRTIFRHGQAVHSAESLLLYAALRDTSDKACRLAADIVVRTAGVPLPVLAKLLNPPPANVELVPPPKVSLVENAIADARSLFSASLVRATKVCRETASTPLPEKKVLSVPAVVDVLGTPGTSTLRRVAHAASEEWACDSLKYNHCHYGPCAPTPSLDLSDKGVGTDVPIFGPLCLFNATRRLWGRKFPFVWDSLLFNKRYVNSLPPVARLFLRVMIEDCSWCSRQWDHLAPIQKQWPCGLPPAGPDLFQGYRHDWVTDNPELLTSWTSLPEPSTFPPREREDMGVIDGLPREIRNLVDCYRRSFPTLCAVLPTSDIGDFWLGVNKTEKGGRLPFVYVADLPLVSSYTAGERGLVTLLCRPVSGPDRNLFAYRFLFCVTGARPPWHAVPANLDAPSSASMGVWFARLAWHCLKNPSQQFYRAGAQVAWPIPNLPPPILAAPRYFTIGSRVFEFSFVCAENRAFLPGGWSFFGQPPVASVLSLCPSANHGKIPGEQLTALRALVRFVDADRPSHGSYRVFAADPPALLRTDYIGMEFAPDRPAFHSGVLWEELGSGVLSPLA